MIVGKIRHLDILADATQPCYTDWAEASMAYFIEELIAASRCSLPIVWMTGSVKTVLSASSTLFVNELDLLRHGFSRSAPANREAWLARLGLRRYSTRPAPIDASGKRSSG